MRWARPRKIFVCSTTDLFARFVPNNWINKHFAVMAIAKQHLFLVLTKRVDRASEYLDGLSAGLGRIQGAMEEIGFKGAAFDPCPAGWPFPNVMVGASVENQDAAYARRDHLRQISKRGWLTYVSYEPALGPVDWSGWEFIDWMISGGRAAHARVRVTRIGYALLAIFVRRTIFLSYINNGENGVPQWPIWGRVTGLCLASGKRSPVAFSMVKSGTNFRRPVMADAGAFGWIFTAVCAAGIVVGSVWLFRKIDEWGDRYGR